MQNPLSYHPTSAALTLLQACLDRLRNTFKEEPLIREPDWKRLPPTTRAGKVTLASEMHSLQFGTSALLTRQWPPVVPILKLKGGDIRRSNLQRDLNVLYV